MEQTKGVTIRLVDVLPVIAEKKLKPLAQVECLRNQTLNVYSGVFCDQFATNSARFATTKSGPFIPLVLAQALANPAKTRRTTARSPSRSYRRLQTSFSRFHLSWKRLFANRSDCVIERGLTLWNPFAVMLPNDILRVSEESSNVRYRQPRH